MTLAVWRCPCQAPRIESLRLKFALKFQWFFPLVVAWPHHFIRIPNHHAVSTPLSALSYSGLSTALLEVPPRQKSWRPPGGLPLYADYKGENCWVKKIEQLLSLVRNVWCGNARQKTPFFRHTTPSLMRRRKPTTRSGHVECGGRDVLIRYFLWFVQYVFILILLLR